MPIFNNFRNASQQFANEIIKLQKQFYENVCIKAKQKQDADLLEVILKNTHLIDSKF